MAFSARSFTEEVKRPADVLVLGRPPAARRGALHRPRREAIAVDPEEQLGRGREDAVPTGVQVGGVSAPLGEAQVAVEPALVAANGRAQPEGVVHLVGVAGCDVFTDPLDGVVVASSVDRRFPRVTVLRSLVPGRWQDRLLPAFEHGEPHKGQAGEGIVDRARADLKGRIQAGSGFVRDEPSGPQTSRGCALRSRDGGRHLVRAHSLEHADGLDQSERRGGTRQVVEPGLDHAPLRDVTSSMRAGRSWSASATTPRSASRKIGASGSLLIAMIVLDPFMPTMCWRAPLIPTAM